MQHLNGQSITPAFLDFVLGQVRIQTNVCSRQRVDHGYAMQSRTVPDYNLIWMHQGRAVWVLDGTPHKLSAGDLLVVPPGVLHHAYSTTRRMTLGSIHVEAALPGGQSLFELLAPPLLRHVKPGSWLAKYLGAALSEWDRPERSQTLLMLASWARLMTLELFRYDAGQGSLRPRAIDPLIAEIIEKLNHRLERPITLDELAEWSGYSSQHLNRVFRRVLGITPLQYLTRLRLEQAAAYLSDGRRTIRAVAAQCGFDDAYYFSRVFKQHYGRSPAQYRLSAGSENPS